MTDMHSNSCTLVHTTDSIALSQVCECYYVSWSWGHRHVT